MSRFDPRLGGRAGQARAGGGGTSPLRYPAAHHGPTKPVALPGSGIEFVQAPDVSGPPEAVGNPPWQKFPHGVRMPEFGGFFPTVQAFDVVTAAAGLSVGAASGAEVVGFTVPSKCNAVLLGWGHECCDVTAWPSFQWRVAINGSTQPGFDFSNQVAGIEYYRLSSSRLYIPSGGRVALFAQNASAGALVVFGRIKGVYWPYEESF